MEDSSNDIFKEMNIRGLRSLYIRSHKEFEFFRTMVNALSYDQEKLSDDYAKHFKKKLKMRIANLEDTIDVHLNLIGGLEKYMDKSYLYKLKVLELNEDKIRLRDEKCLRLVDFSQSYYIYDSNNYRRQKAVLERIDREILDLKFYEQEVPVYC